MTAGIHLFTEGDTSVTQLSCCRVWLLLAIGR